MGEYLNPGNINFQEALNTDIYVDKTMLLAQTNRVIRTQDKYLCVSRPRRFGKSMTLNMLAAYYSRGCESREMFSPLKIASSPDFEKHLNQYNVIQICATDFIKEDEDISVKNSLSLLQKYLVRDLKREYADADVLDWDNIPMALKDIYADTKIPFVFLVDEWDCIFREREKDFDGKKLYLHFLRDLLKDRSYVALAYMTGIFPVKQYGEESSLNMFREYSMVNQHELAKFTGFTEEEVSVLCQQYDMDFDLAKLWYNGYDVNGISIYNPQSVALSMPDHRYEGHWVSTSTYDALKDYITANFDGLKDKVIQLIAGARIPINVRKFKNDSFSMRSAEEVLACLMHIGYLTYHMEDGTVSIPNHEVRQEFQLAIEAAEWNPINESIKESIALLSDTIAGNEKRVAEQLDKIHTCKIERTTK